MGMDCILATSGEVGGCIALVIVFSLLPVRKLQTPTPVYSAPIIKSPPSSCHREQFIHRSQLELGFWLMGLHRFSPTITYWISLKIDGPPSLIAWPRFFSFKLLVNLVILMLRYSAGIGRGHPSRNVSTSFQDPIDSFQAELKQVQFMAFSPRQCSKLFEKATRLFDLESRCRDGLEVGLGSAIFLLNIRCKVLECYCIMLWRNYSRYPTLLPTIYDAGTDHDFGLILLSMSNSSFKKILQVSSQWERSFSPSSLLKERTLLPCWLSLRCHSVSIVISRIFVIFFLAVVSSISAFGLSSVMVMLSPNGKRCLSTSMSYLKVTRLYLWGLTTRTLPTHLSYATNSLSFSYEKLSVLNSVVLKLSCIKLRGWKIPSVVCTFQV